MSFSVITVNYNNQFGLQKTICNVADVRAHTLQDIELIVVDGGSSDGSLDTIRKNSQHINKCVYEQDEGIFDAMNKGIDLATNEWLIFMNSGDTFYDIKILSKIPQQALSPSFNFIYGDKIESGTVCKSKPISNLKVGIIHACHQSMLFRRSLNIKYDNNIKLYGDFSYVADHYLAGPDKVYYFGEVIADTEPNGVGSNVSFTKRREKYQLVYSRFGVAYMFLSALHKLKLILIGR